MHSIAVASLLAAAATITSAAPTGSGSNAKQPRAWFYACFKNGFRGECSVDPCDMHWCPDYKPGTYWPKQSNPPAPPIRQHVPTITNPTWYECPGSNQFKGYCTKNPCHEIWCEDYEDFTSNVKPESPLNHVAKRSAHPQTDPTVCAPGTGFFQSCSTNGFRGCCKGDACSGSWCPDYKPNTFEPLIPAESTPPSKRDEFLCGLGEGYFQSCSNGFRGCCKSDACAGPDAYCPDPAIAQTSSGFETANKRGHDETVCAPGTGYFQNCSNGFRGCCKSDACAGSDAYCPDPAIAQTFSGFETVNKRDETVCASDTGYFQSCSNGFRGCCKSDACSGPDAYCPDPAIAQNSPVVA